MTIKIKISTSLLLGLCLLTSFNALAQKKTKEMDKMWGDSKVSSDALKNGKGKFFDESNFGMFIHWGLYSNLGGKWKGKTYYGIGSGS